MKYCQKCGHELVDEAIICTSCGCAVAQGNAYSAVSPAYYSQQDVVSVGLCILSFLIPLFGIIYWPVKHKETPKRAKACGITAIVSWVVGILFSVIFYSVVLGEMMYYYW